MRHRLKNQGKKLRTTTAKINEAETEMNEKHAQRVEVARALVSNASKYAKIAGMETTRMAAVLLVQGSDVAFSIAYKAAHEAFMAYSQAKEENKATLKVVYDTTTAALKAVALEAISHAKELSIKSALVASEYIKLGLETSLERMTKVGKDMAEATQEFLKSKTAAMSDFVERNKAEAWIRTKNYSAYVASSSVEKATNLLFQAGRMAVESSKFLAQQTAVVFKQLSQTAQEYLKHAATLMATKATDAAEHLKDSMSTMAASMKETVATKAAEVLHAVKEYVLNDMSPKILETIASVGSAAMNTMTNVLSYAYTLLKHGTKAGQVALGVMWFATKILGQQTMKKVGLIVVKAVIRDIIANSVKGGASALFSAVVGAVVGGGVGTPLAMATMLHAILVQVPESMKTVADNFQGIVGRALYDEVLLFTTGKTSGEGLDTALSAAGIAAPFIKHGLIWYDPNWAAALGTAGAVATAAT